MEQFQLNIQRLQKRIDELEVFDPTTVTNENDSNLLTLKITIRQTLSDIFKEESSDWKLYINASELDPDESGRNMRSLGSKMNSDGSYQEDAQEYKRDLQDSVRKGKNKSLSILKKCILMLKEKNESIDRNIQTKSVEFNNKIFIVHGHDEGTREKVARFIQQLGFDPIILHEQPSKGRTIIKKFREEAAGVGFAIVLMTPDDHGGKANSDIKPRARQNVVFELGFFIGALGPEKVAALIKGDVEKPSDFDGVVYIPLDEGKWKTDLANELKAAGFHVDFNKMAK